MWDLLELREDETPREFCLGNLGTKKTGNLVPGLLKQWENSDRVRSLPGLHIGKGKTGCEVGLHGDLLRNPSALSLDSICGGLPGGGKSLRLGSEAHRVYGALEPCLNFFPLSSGHPDSAYISLSTSSQFCNVLWDLKLVSLEFLPTDLAFGRI